MPLSMWRFISETVPCACACLSYTLIQCSWYDCIQASKMHEFFSSSVYSVARCLYRAVWWIFYFSFSLFLLSFHFILFCYYACYSIHLPISSVSFVKRCMHNCRQLNINIYNTFNIIFNIMQQTKHTLNSLSPS